MEEVLPPGKKITKPRVEPDLAKVEKLAALGLSNKEIALALEFHECTFYERIKDMPDFQAAVERGRAKGVALAAGYLDTAMQKGDIGAIKFYLQCVAKWKLITALEHTGKDGGAIEHKEIGDMGKKTTNELTRIVEEATGAPVKA